MHIQCPWLLTQFRKSKTPLLLFSTLSLQTSSLTSRQEKRNCKMTKLADGGRDSVPKVFRNFEFKVSLGFEKVKWLLFLWVMTLIYRENNSQKKKKKTLHLKRTYERGRTESKASQHHSCFLSNTNVNKVKVPRSVLDNSHFHSCLETFRFHRHCHCSRSNLLPSFSPVPYRAPVVPTPLRSLPRSRRCGAVTGPEGNDTAAAAQQADLSTVRK